MTTKIKFFLFVFLIFFMSIAYGLDFDPIVLGEFKELPDAFHIRGKADIKYFESIKSENIVDSIENPKAYILRNDGIIAIAIKKESKYIVFDLALGGNDFSLERKNINNIGSDELIVRWHFTTGGRGHTTSISGIVVWDIDSYNCLLSFETEHMYGNWWKEYDIETEEITVSGYEFTCFGYTIELEKAQLTIQLTAQSYDNECIEGISGKKYFYKLTESGFVLDRKENAELGNKENPLYGKIYKKITDIPELKNWTTLGGGVIYPKEPESYDFRFGISNYKDDNGNMIFVFVEFVEHDKKGRNPKYKILDTLNIGKLRNNEFAWYQQCRKNTILDSEIIAILAVGECKNYEDNIVKAWRANTKTGKIQAIENLIGIDCARE